MPKARKESSRGSARVNSFAKPSKEEKYESFYCSGCLETIDNSPSVPMTEEDKLCETCFVEGYKPQFEAALASETAYPVRWGETPLTIKNFKKFFTKSFLQDFEIKAKEYGLKPKDRLYCAGKSSTGVSCDHFLGGAARHRTSRPCPSCKSLTCNRCKELWECPLKSLDHYRTCTFATFRLDPAFEGQVKGHDYQKCPGCETVIYRGEGCNHMTCAIPACESHFCFLCEEETDGTKRHWRKGCPIYGRPSTLR